LTSALLPHRLPVVTQKRNLPPGISVISLRLPTSLHERLKETAKESERTISQEARRAITLHLERAREAA
jgi:predicted solute-binding protein